MAGTVVTFPGMRLQQPRQTGGEAGDMSPSQLRWRAEIEYKDESGGQAKTVYFEEISELEDIIERGPDWNSLKKCELFLNLPFDHPLPHNKDSQ